MSHFHILPSNVAPETFPANNAASYSTPVSNPYSLNGKWEVALMSMTYSTCINTFHHDVLKVEKPFSLIEHLKKVGTPIQLTIPFDISVHKVVQVINEKCKGLIEFELYDNNKLVWYVFKNTDAIVVLSINLMELLRFENEVLTSYDKRPFSYKELIVNKEWPSENYFITIIPFSYSRVSTIQLKSENEEIEKNTLIKRFNERLNGIATLQLDGNHFIIHKQRNDDFVLINSRYFHEMLTQRQAGIFKQLRLRGGPHSFAKSFTSEWCVTLIPIDATETDPTKMSIPITIPPRSFKRQSDALPFLNELINDTHIKFSLNKSNIIQVSIKDENLAIYFSNTLRDIFAFDQNKYAGKGIFRASDIFSLTRRINYLYVYSSIGNFVRIGNTEAPLLAIIPFNADARRNLLVEKTFKMPIYVPVIQEHISQINIEIHDGAGELIPFASDAVTSICLHFRQL